MAQIILDSNNNLIQGDFDNATLNNRTKLQTTTTNATTNVYVVPNGSSTSAGVSVANNSNLTNASKIVMATNGTTDTQIISGVNGSGTYLPLSFYTNNALAAQISTAGVFSATGGIAASSMPTGSVLQVVSSTTTTRTTTSSTSYVDVGLSASITPSSVSNNILIFVTYTLGNDNSSYASWSQLVRGSTQIAQRTYYAGGVGSTYAAVSASISVLDSPSTTSSTTYKMQIKSDNASGVTSFNGPATMSYSGGTPTNYATITLMEIKG